MGSSASKGSDNDELVDNLLKDQFLKTPSIQQIFRAVDRGLYFTKENRNHAYDDCAWRSGNIHLSAPGIYCEVLENLELGEGMSFLNLGSGTGYLNTMAGLIIGSYGVNYGVEVHKEVIEYAYNRLDEFKRNAEAIDEYDFCEPKFFQGNCLQLSSENKLYDRVYCGAACPVAFENYMKNLIKINGILVMPLEDLLVKIRRISETCWEKKSITPVSFAHMIEPSPCDANKPQLLLSNPEPLSLQVICRSSIRRLLLKIIREENPKLKNHRIRKDLRNVSYRSRPDDPEDLLRRDPSFRMFLLHKHSSPFFSWVPRRGFQDDDEDDDDDDDNSSRDREDFEACQRELDDSDEDMEKNEKQTEDGEETARLRKEDDEEESSRFRKEDEEEPSRTRKNGEAESPRFRKENDEESSRIRKNGDEESSRFRKEVDEEPSRFRKEDESLTLRKGDNEEESSRFGKEDALGVYERLSGRKEDDDEMSRLKNGGRMKRKKAHQTSTSSSDSGEAMEVEPAPESETRKKTEKGNTSTTSESLMKGESSADKSSGGAGCSSNRNAESSGDSDDDDEEDSSNWLRRKCRELRVRYSMKHERHMEKLMKVERGLMRNKIMADMLDTDSDEEEEEEEERVEPPNVSPSHGELMRLKIKALPLPPTIQSYLNFHRTF